jgi:hypothetical protein
MGNTTGIIEAGRHDDLRRTGFGRQRAAGGVDVLATMMTRP